MVTIPSVGSYRTDQNDISLKQFSKQISACFNLTWSTKDELKANRELLLQHFLRVILAVVDGGKFGSKMSLAMIVRVQPGLRCREITIALSIRVMPIVQTHGCKETRQLS